MIYLDSGATALYRPKEVGAAVKESLSLGNPGRGGHRAAMEASKRLYEARESLARHFGCPSPEGVAFFYNATAALNCLVKTLVPPGGRILISTVEHNALRRPALSLAGKGVTVDRFTGHGSEEEIVSSFSAKLAHKPDLAAFLYTSNVCPQTLPVGRLCALCRAAGVLSVVDCAQAAGHRRLDMQAIGADALVIPSHKGLMGIAGAGILLCGERMKRALENAPTRVEGGSGIRSFDEGMPEDLPERLEAGTPGLPAILSARAGVGWLEKVGYGEVEERLSRLARKCAEGVSAIEGLRLRGISQGGVGGGPLLFTVRNGRESIVAAELYDRGICLREGFHCAPDAHRSIGTEKTGGLRVSFSVFNTPRQIDRFLWELDQTVRRLDP